MTLSQHPALSTHPEQQYLDLLRILLEAPVRPDRTGTGVRGIFDYRMEFDLADGFPLLTTKKLPFRLIAIELLWFLSGSTNAKVLEDQGCNIWREWGDPVSREMGPIYSQQWRRMWGMRSSLMDRDNDDPNQGCAYEQIDQIANVLESLRSDPYGRRHIVTAWNPADVPDMALPPCHMFFQLYVESDERLSLKMYQRSADVFLGVPFNIASYALLLSMFASALDRKPGRFIWDGGDVHLYSNHVAQAREQILRKPRPFPALSVAKRDDLDSWTLGDFSLRDYEPHAHIPGEVAV